VVPKKQGESTLRTSPPLARQRSCQSRRNDGKPTLEKPREINVAFVELVVESPIRGIVEFPSTVEFPEMIGGMFVEFPELTGGTFWLEEDAGSLAGGIAVLEVGTITGGIPVPEAGTLIGGISVPEPTGICSFGIHEAGGTISLR
jgi:hypothetical protein